MSEAVQIELIKALPSVVLILVGGGLLIWLRRPFQDHVLPRLGSVKVMWFEMTLVQQELARSEARNKVLGDAGKVTQWTGFDAKAQAQVVTRAEHVAPILRGACLLWVDDRPQVNHAERKILGHFGVSIDLATSSQEAMALIAATPTTYDAVISDIERKGEGVEKAGVVFLEKMRKRGFHHPVIFSVGTLEPGIPKGAYGITNRAGERFHRIFDVLERTRDWRGSPVPAPSQLLS